MVIIAGAVQIAKTAWRFRKQIYKGLVAHDRIIGTTWKKGGYSKWTSAGVRHGAFGGTIIGSFLSPGIDQSGNGIQKILQPDAPNQIIKTYPGRAGRNGRRYQKQYRYRPRRCRPYRTRRYAS